MWYANLIGGVAFLLLGAATIFLSWRDLPYTSDFSPGPGFLPLWLGIGLMVAAIPVIVTEVRKRNRSQRLFRPETMQCIKVLALIAAVFLLLPVFGFSFGLALITAGGMRLMGKHRWLSCVVTVIVTAVCIHFVFGQWLAIPLPQGMIGW